MTGILLFGGGSGKQTGVRMIVGENTELHCFVPDLEEHEIFQTTVDATGSIWSWILNRLQILTLSFIL